MKKQLIFIVFLTFLMTGYSQEEDIQFEFLEWVKDGDLEEAKKYLAKGADVNGKTTGGSNAGEYAIWNIEDGDALINYLLSNGLDINILNDNEANLLHIAAEYEGSIIMPKLVELGSEINAKDSDGSTPVIIAAENSDLIAIKTLSELGADMSIENEEGKSVIHYLDLEDEEQWNLILNFKLSQVQKDFLLYKSIFDLENSDKAIAVINLGADVNMKDEDGTPIIIHAVQFENTEILKQLISKGVDVNATDEDGLSALWFYYNTETLQILIDSDANVNLNVEDYSSPLFYAIKQADVESVKLLLAAGADPQFKILDQNASAYCDELLKMEVAPGAEYYADINDQKEHTKKWKSEIKEISKLLK